MTCRSQCDGSRSTCAAPPTTSTSRSRSAPRKPRCSTTSAPRQGGPSSRSTATTPPAPPPAAPTCSAPCTPRGRGGSTCCSSCGSTGSPAACPTCWPCSPNSTTPGWRSCPRPSRSTPPPPSAGCSSSCSACSPSSSGRPSSTASPRAWPPRPPRANGPAARRPYGYWADRDTQKLVPHPEEAPHLKEIFRLYADERFGTRAIAAELNRRGVRNRTGKPWSGHTVARILANPAYAGDIANGDVYVEDAHEALIDRPTWQRAASIAAERADPQTQRAASNSDYDLTGKITCPGCGHKYIGTSATGRSRTYRYYTCFSRVRYGTHGCDAARLPADDTEAAVLHALADFYTQAPALIADAVARAQARHRDGHADRHAEAGAVLAQIKNKQAAIDRYFTAFENGTMDDTTAGPRVIALRAEIDQLQARHREITDTIGDQPAAPPPHTIERLGTYLHDILDAGTPAERKAAVEALIAEIRITEEGIIPVFRIPGPRSPIPGETSTTSTSAVPAPSRFAQWCVRWGGWGSNPRPTDYESAALPFTQVRQGSGLGI